MSMLPPPPPPPRTPVAGVVTGTGWKTVGRVKAIMLLVTVAVMGLAAWFVAATLAPVLRENRVTPSGIADWYFRAPWLVLLLSLPAVWACVPLFRGTKRPFLWMTLSTLLLLPPIVFFLLGVVGAIGQIYSKALNG